MALYTRPNGSTAFTDDPAVDPATGADIDAELNGITSTLNALDNANIATTPKIAGSKIDLTTSGFLPIAGGDMTGAVNSLFDGVFRTMRNTGNGRLREYHGSDGGLWGVSYNTYWTGSAWNGRDITDICAVLKIESDGLHYYHAISASAGTVPTWVEIFHADVDGAINSSNNVFGVREKSIDWANAGGISQWLLNGSELTNTLPFTDVLATKVYIPANANTLEYYAYIKTASNTANFRLQIGSTNGTTLSTTSTSYVMTTLGTLDISAVSGWQNIDIQLGGDSTAHYVREIYVRII